MDIIESLIEIEIPSDNFLKVKETLERIGVANFTDKILFQSCHILHKRQKFYIVHFKEMFLLDGKSAELADEDIARRNSIACLLDQWGLIKIPEASITKIAKTGTLPLVNGQIKKLKIVPHKEKTQWKLVSKYTIGKKK